MLRQGRWTQAQRSAYAKYWPIFGVDADNLPLDSSRLFGNQAPLVMEIGSGSGDLLIALACRHPENNYLAVEVYLPGIGRLLQLIQKYQLKNIRIIRQDAINVLGNWLMPGSLSQLLLLFPDPWPKKRHHKRRLVNSHFLSVVHRVLADHGLFYMATDWQDYALQIQHLTNDIGYFQNLSSIGGFVPRPAWFPITRYEKRAHGLGHVVRYFVYRKNLDVKI